MKKGITIVIALFITSTNISGVFTMHNLTGHTMMFVSGSGVQFPLLDGKKLNLNVHPKSCNDIFRVVIKLDKKLVMSKLHAITYGTAVVVTLDVEKTPVLKLFRFYHKAYKEDFPLGNFITEELS